MNTTGELNFLEDRANAREVIDWLSLKSFIQGYLDEKIGDGFTLHQEIQYLGRQFATIAVINIDCYDARRSYRISEWTMEERVALMENAYEKAVKKILWLNSQCRTLIGEGFVNRHINKANIDDVHALVDGFSFALENPEAMEG